jgi:hypothetical protein
MTDDPTMLIEAIKARLGERAAGSFQLMGEDLALIGVGELRAALDASEAALGQLEPRIRRDVIAEEAAHATEAHAWLVKHNRSVHGRIAGYLALGRRCDFAYPWPVVAILGICQVIAAMNQNRMYAIAGRAAARLGWSRYERIADRSDDVLRRTNRGIFADSVPTVLRVLRAAELERKGRPQIAAAILDGVAAPLWDGELRRLAHLIRDGLAISDERDRFHALAAATLHHFDREQAIFTHHMGGSRTTAPDREGALAIKQIVAPAIERTRRGERRLVFRPYRLPAGFDMRGHAGRVRELGKAFVVSVTADLDDYATARDWVTARFDRR